MKKILICASILFLPKLLLSQTNYLDGYILKSKYDTIYGKIDNKSYYYNSLYCDFKPKDKNTTIRFYPKDIYGYRFNDGKFYIAKQIEIKNKKSTYFLEYLINGELDVYFLQDKGIVNHYFVSKDTILTELKYSKEIKNIDGKNMITESNKHRGILNYLTYEYPELQQEINKIDEPDHKNLIHIAEKYHEKVCKDENCIIYEKKIQNKIKLAALGGTNYIFSSSINIDKRWNPSYGFNLLFQKSQISERNYIGLGLVWEGLIDSSRNEVRIPLSINYIHPKQGFSPAFSYGFDLNSLGMTQMIKVGLNYRVRKASIYLVVDIKTAVFIKPYATAQRFGLMIDIN